MKRKLKRAITFYVTSGIVIVTPVIVSIVIAIIGASYWHWEGRAALALLAGAVLSVILGICFIALIDEHESDIQEWMREPEVEKPTPKAGAWKEKD